MTLQNTPRGMRLHIGIFGRRNVGKSSLLNAILRQNVSIVSEIAGTTTDPVEKPMELLPLGPVLFIDTAGIDDDAGNLGEERVRRTRSVFDRTELAILVVSENIWGNFEELIRQEFSRRNVPLLVIFNKSDITPVSKSLVECITHQYQLPSVSISTKTGEGLATLREKILESVPEEWLSSPPIVADLLPSDGTVILVIPIDKEAPKGRLILPQVQTIRDLLDAGKNCMITRETELKIALRQLKEKPALVITDSQVFKQVAEIIPPDVFLTGFSVLFAQVKGDITTLIEGTKAIKNLRPGDHILIAESCSHHPIGEDIGRVKIPRWLETYVHGSLAFHHVQGHDFPEDLSPYQLVIHCGGCMTNRKAILSRILKCAQQNVPITNYGLTIAFSQGIFDRAIKILEQKNETE
ncbi:MAG: [FeFe] hydrogenase H-cluster maturation GTPase HydF [Planctomycetia bacterium]|nr:[FeFe] hydrogenase H-cluster maturation GTPase HydF [Planctomycetia bacterium]